MNKLAYGTFDPNNADTPFLQTQGYVDPASGEQTRRQLGQPLREIKEFLDDTMPVDSNDKVAQLYVSANGLKYRTTSGGAWTDISGGIPSGGTTGQVLIKKSNADNDVGWGAFSFVGMVVMGTNLTTEASVKAIYGNSTSWSLLSSVLLKTEHVFGNGKTLGMTNGSIVGGHQNAGILGNAESLGVAVGTSITSAGASYLALGSPTKVQLGDHLENSGLIADTTTVYTWERTA